MVKWHFVIWSPVENDLQQVTVADVKELEAFKHPDIYVSDYLETTSRGPLRLQTRFTYPWSNEIPTDESIEDRFVAFLRSCLVTQAENYVLSLETHGTGMGLLPNGTPMTSEHLHDLILASGLRPRILIFDACLMGNLGNLRLFSDIADYIIASSGYLSYGILSQEFKTQIRPDVTVKTMAEILHSIAVAHSERFSDTWPTDINLYEREGITNLDAFVREHRLPWAPNLPKDLLISRGLGPFRGEVQEEWNENLDLWKAWHYLQPSDLHPTFRALYREAVMIHRVLIGTDYTELGDLGLQGMGVIKSERYFI